MDVMVERGCTKKGLRRRLVCQLQQQQQQPSPQEWKRFARWVETTRYSTAAVCPLLSSRRKLWQGSVLSTNVRRTRMQQGECCVESGANAVCTSPGWSAQDAITGVCHLLTNPRW